MTDDLATQKPSLLKSVSQNVIIPGVTGLLILIVLLQSFQLQQLKGYTQGFMQGQEVSTVSAPTQATAPTAPARPTNNGYPSQVGGC